MINAIPLDKHTCLFYNSKDELVEFLAPYFKTGLENNEFCVWVVPETFEAGDAKIALSKAVKNLDYYIEKGKMRIGTCGEYYLASGVFTAFKMLEYWAKMEKEVLDQGFDGMRVAGDGGWGLGEQWINLSYYEEEISNSIDKLRITAICTYPVDKLSLKQLFHIGKTHGLSFAKQMGEWAKIDSARFK